jgi:hypothetical protein
LKEGLIAAIGFLANKLQPDNDLPAELAQRYKKWIAEANSAKVELPGYNLLRTTIKTARNKKRWWLASELLHLSYAFRQLLPPDVANTMDHEMAKARANQQIQRRGRKPATGIVVEAEESETGGESCSVTCPHCGAITTMPGFVQGEMYFCKECGEMVGDEADGKLQK